MRDRVFQNVKSVSLTAAALAGALGAAMLAQAAFAEEPARDVIYVPTPQAVVDKMLEMAKVTKDDYLIDLGSGDGRIPITAAKTYGATAFGIDIDPQRIEEARENLKKAGVEEKVTFKEGNLFELPLDKADVITMYLLTSINLKLRPKLLELDPGTRIVSHAFDMGEWKPDQMESVEGKTAYLWIVPAKVEGEWQVKEKDGDSFKITLNQEFQKFSGQAEMEKGNAEVTDGELEGSRIEFRVKGENGEPRMYRGEVNGTAIKGDDWEATKAS